MEKWPWAGEDGIFRGGNLTRLLIEQALKLGRGNDLDVLNLSDFKDGLIGSE